MHYSEQYRKAMLMIKASSVARICLSSIVTIFLLMNEPFGEWLPFVGIFFSFLYIASVCGPYLARWEDLAQKHLRSEKMFGELATDISAYFVSLGKLKPQEDDDEVIRESVNLGTAMLIVYPITLNMPLYYPMAQCRRAPKFLIDYEFSL